MVMSFTLQIIIITFFSKTYKITKTYINNNKELIVMPATGKDGTSISTALSQM